MPCMLSSQVIIKNEDVKQLVFNPKIEFILDELNAERDIIMKEYLQELR